MAQAREDREQKTAASTESAVRRGGQNRQSMTTTAPQRSSSAASRRNDYPIAVAPFDMFSRMSREMDRLFGGTLLPSFGGSNVLSPASETLWSPQVEMFERDGKLVVRADLPGLSKDDVKVELRNDMVIIEGQRREEREEKDDGFFRSERSYGSFYRAIPLPEGTSGEHCKATFKNGVLEVTLDAPKEKDRTGHRIAISEGN